MKLLVLVLFSSMGALAVWQHRYDFLKTQHWEIVHYNSTLNTLDSCECRKLCVEDISCTGYSLTKTKKEQVFRCNFAKQEGVQYHLGEARGTDTYVKERKPKEFFVTAKKHKNWNSDDYWSICGQEKGFPGFIWTYHDWINATKVINRRGKSVAVPLFKNSDNKYKWLNTSLNSHRDNALSSIDTESDRVEVTSSGDVNGIEKDDDRHLLCFKYI
ncbi:hypothetical protein FHG87_005813 [Trinorchestia longiramus]|nr:hypothetical protein FHG87_005813 [Trinorchestia longiramus]